ncbi:MAG: putative cytosolic protein [Candidatus Moranbacteria bacterium GW2011_GWC1_45_18]|nr:MAG: putative cytosolic protein [Candidatus Moranbacteria bacterium GW2011_GWC2_40_12]KKT34185.1 MAG: putative cytosolic protein [Candidatus Moranbacteria bacterium GW2011_GWF2_44_10]KKT70847.1 MAG: putative cytosolic protein [Candidatus Moranbacteria bacterium GW2011_GWF1_44_4]KKU00603.1 MAG: putative cytosolic protein [Candidatus Moranbacteria bacterium GW2011_GWC1_45_18]
MLTIQQVKELLNDPNYSDEEIAQIRDEFRSLAEIIFEKWQEEKGIKIDD